MRADVARMSFERAVARFSRLSLVCRSTDSEKASRTLRRGERRRSLKYMRARDTAERINSGTG